MPWPHNRGRPGRTCITLPCGGALHRERGGLHAQGVRTVGRHRGCAPWAGTGGALRGQAQGVRAVGRHRGCASWAGTGGARRGQAQRVRAVGRHRGCALWAAGRAPPAPAPPQASLGPLIGPHYPGLRAFLGVVQLGPVMRVGAWNGQGAAAGGC